MKPALRFWPIMICLGSFGSILPAAGREKTAGPAAQLEQKAADATQEEAVVYPAEFFDRYRPTTALDMVRQLPAFQIDNGDSTRGFGGAAGNVLIDSRRPSAKQDALSDILSRIPAGHVERIELIRGQVDGIELHGQPEVANVILRSRTEFMVRWDANLRYNFDFGLTPEGSVSISDRWMGVQYNAGLNSRRYRTGELGAVDVLDPDGNPTERGDDHIVGSGHYLGGSLSATTWAGETFLQFDTSFSRGTLSNKFQTSHRKPTAPGTAPRIEYFHELPRTTTFEIGVSAERLLQPELVGKAILLYDREDDDPASLHRIVDAMGRQTLFRRADTNTVSTEGIARLEFNWTRWPGHVIQANVERAHNVLDNALVQLVDAGAGPVLVSVPGANSRVEETRWDFLLKDSWSLGQIDLNYGLGMEASTILQSGDTNLERSFTFLKPQVLFIYSPVEERQTRLRFAREVGQLDFRDFVSATVFQEHDLALGNPNLRPETTWIAELSHERRFGDLGVATLTVFQHWISDVEDLLPLSSDYEVPGNIGSGRRWGIKFESTVPLDRLKLVDARLDIQARWQNSLVTDPVTGNDRVLSGPNDAKGDIPYTDDDTEYALSVDYRQDFETARVAWGWGMITRAGWPVFKVNELVTHDEGIDLMAFVETARWLGLTFRLEGQNLLDFERTRERTVFTGRRDLSPVSFLQARNRFRGTRVSVTVSGAF